MDRGGGKGKAGGYRGGGRPGGGRGVSRGRGHQQTQWRRKDGESQKPSTSSTTTALQSTTSTLPPPPAVIEDVDSDLSSLDISRQEPPSSSPPPPTEKLQLIHRPDIGGKLSNQNIRLCVNHFPVRFNSNSTIKHYDVDVKPMVPPKHGRPSKLSKSLLAEIRNKWCKDNPANSLLVTAYDGEKNIFSAVDLPTGEFIVKLEDDEKKVQSFVFTVKLVNELKLRKLKDYLSGTVTTIPRDILQGMDVVVKENPTRQMITVGRSFHHREGDRDLGAGLTASRGFQHSLKATSQGLSLCLDYSVLAFRKKISVLDFLKEHIGGYRDRNSAEDALRGLKVTVTHRVTKQKYVIRGLTRKPTRELSFSIEDPEKKIFQREVTVIDYFLEKHQKKIRWLHYPCLDLGRGNRENYVPMEFCELVEGQIYPKEKMLKIDSKERMLKKAAKILTSISVVRPQERRDAISRMVESRDGPCKGEIIRNFGLEVNTNMTSVVGRILGPPQLKLGGPGGKSTKVTVDGKRQWNLVGKSVVEGKIIDKWAIIDFSYRPNHAEEIVGRNNFILNLIRRCRSLGMHMDDPVLCRSASMYQLTNPEELYRSLEQVTTEAQSKSGRGQLQLLVCVMEEQHPGYKYLKWISETKLGVVTQCCLSNLAYNGMDQYLANLAIKINAKLGGSNVELFDKLPCFKDQGHVMFIGADVNHPGARDRSSPSIAAVVATVNWPAANRYIGKLHGQAHRCEQIVNFVDMCMELVDSYARLNRVKPAKIVIFRDGVSEGQFDMVLNKELLLLKQAFEGRDYFPTLTLIIAQKRHQTRLFPDDKNFAGNIPPDDRNFTGNIPPGTVVDTKIVHPFEFDFYLCSHYGSKGTSKPTHYHVLWDEHNFTSDELQSMIYNMCFTFARCTKPVSLVPPVYYADLAAYRGRLYQDAAVMAGVTPSSASTASSSFTSCSSSVTTTIDENWFRLHSNLENYMFFV